MTTATGQDRARPKRADALPLGLPPLGLSRGAAAAYVGVSTGLFNEMVQDGRMPLPKCINRRTVWDRRALDSAFADLPDRRAVNELGRDAEGKNPWDA